MNLPAVSTKGVWRRAVWTFACLYAGFWVVTAAMIWLLGDRDIDYPGMAMTILVTAALFGLILYLLAVTLIRKRRVQFDGPEWGVLFALPYTTGLSHDALIDGLTMGRPLLVLATTALPIALLLPLSGMLLMVSATRRVGSKAFCTRCEYERGDTANGEPAGSERCPECGHHWNKPNGVMIGRRVTEKRLMVAGFALMIAGAGQPFLAPRIERIVAPLLPSQTLARDAARSRWFFRSVTFEALLERSRHSASAGHDLAWVLGQTLHNGRFLTPIHQQHVQQVLSSGVLASPTRSELADLLVKLNVSTRQPPLMGCMSEVMLMGCQNSFQLLGIGPTVWVLAREMVIEPSGLTVEFERPDQLKTFMPCRGGYAPSATGVACVTWPHAGPAQILVTSWVIVDPPGVVRQPDHVEFDSSGRPILDPPPWLAELVFTTATVEVQHDPTAP